MEISKLIKEKFGGRLRVRSCAIILQNNNILVVDHKGLNKANTYLAPPGGEVRFGESLSAAVKRECYEETGLQIQPGQLLFIHEYIESSIHAIEFFFCVEKFKGALITGNDPEISDDEQIISEVKFIDYETLKMTNEDRKHQIFYKFTSLEELIEFRGHFQTIKSD